MLCQLLDGRLASQRFSICARRIIAFAGIAHTRRSFFPESRQLVPVSAATGAQHAADGQTGALSNSRHAPPIPPCQFYC
jgi:hypothetical protein